MSLRTYTMKFACRCGHRWTLHDAKVQRDDACEHCGTVSLPKEVR